MPPLQRNLTLLPWFAAARGAMPWLPVTFLFASQRLGAERALQVVALYYLAGVLLEVPSGWMSDRLGRRPTLVLAACAQTIGGVLFATGDSFAAFACGQIAISAGWAFVSGTDTSLLYESLQRLERSGELARREAQLATWGFAALSLSSLLGGVLGSFDLVWPFVASSVFGLLALGLAWRLVEPPHLDTAAAGRRGAPRRMPATLRDPHLRWITGWVVVAYVMNHVPFEFLQPWLANLAVRSSDGLPTRTPLLSGLLYAGLMSVGALASSRSGALRERLGEGRTLALAFCVQWMLVLAMTLSVSVAVLPLLLLRSVPAALARPIVAAVAHPRLDDRLRATWFSAVNLGGALCLGAALWLAARFLGDAAAPQPERLQRVLASFAVFGLLAGLALWRLRPGSES